MVYSILTPRSSSFSSSEITKEGPAAITPERKPNEGPSVFRAFPSVRLTLGSKTLHRLICNRWFRVCLCVCKLHLRSGCGFGGADSSMALALWLGSLGLYHSVLRLGDRSTFTEVPAVEHGRSPGECQPLFSAKSLKAGTEPHPVTMYVFCYSASILALVPSEACISLLGMQ